MTKKKVYEGCDGHNAGGKILIFDLETSSLDANRGHILCAAAKWLGAKRIYSWRIDDTPGYGAAPESWYNDSAIVAPLVELCNSAEAVIAYYGDYGRFDVPYLNTRALANGLTPTAPLTVIDPHRTARRTLKLARNSLDAVCTLLGTDTQKTHLPWPDWLKAQFGDRTSMNKLIKYCRNDVAALEEAYLKLRPLIANHPYVGKIVAAGEDGKQCRVCGSVHTQVHSYRRTKSYSIIRRLCQSCGSVYQATKKKVV